MESRTVYEGRVINVRVDQENEKRWETIEHPGAVVILPIDSEENLLLVRQYRRAIERDLIELPAGTLEAGESPEITAQRELREETGYRAKQIRPLFEGYSTPGFCNELLVFFVAHDLVKDPLPQDDNEEITLLRIPFKSAVEMVKKGEIIDLKTIAGILAYA